MKKIIIAMAAISAAFTMASCNKELVEQEDNATAIEGNCIITASTESSLTKTALSGNDTDGYDVIWSDGDIFKLRGETFTLIKGAGTNNGTFQGYVSPTNGSATAYYPASYDGTNWPTEQTYTGSNGITGSPMKAEVYAYKGEISGGKVEFKNAGGILRLTVKGSPSTSITSIMVCTDNTPNITLDCGDGVGLNSTDGAVFHIAMPAGTFSGTSIMFTTANSEYCIKKLKSDLVINRSEITPASIKIDNWTNYSSVPEGALSGTFTVSDEGKKVLFSTGNLYWDGNYYKFEDNQYDCNVTGHQSSFFWSNAAVLARGSEWSLDPDGSMTFFTNADEVTANPDFTVNGQAGLWRTLSKDEWDYLIKRENGIGKATIGGVNGMIIFHDEYDGQTDGLTSIPEGCVFLPAAEDVVYYWSSTLNLESGYPFAESLRYEDGAWPPYVGTTSVSMKCPVRLVTEKCEGVTAPNCKVTFNSNGHGTAPAAIGVPYHSTITSLPADPTADGYTFWGWYKDAACTVEWNLDSDLVSSDITLYAKWLTEGYLCGTFTVDDSGKKVYFSKGNMWYGKTSEEAESATFNFEANQYDYRIKWDQTNKINVRDDEHISYFKWSKNAEVACALQYDDPSASDNDVFFTNATQTTPNPIFTANGQKGMWRTLSKDEWMYLINNNGTAWTIINGIYGLIIFCDGYSGSRTGLTEIPKGCLFLPAAGFRNGDGDAVVLGSDGFYWSASQRSDITATCLRFGRTDVDPDNYFHRSGAMSVRLVTDVVE